ncbi:MAG: S1-like domain-containing RNA-binding protein [bacterium]|nr:S1-like domain-containing RNA-binding protein [bacterium]
MIEIGKKNKLKIVKEVDFGIYLDGEDMGEVLLPLRYLPESYEIDDMLDVFIYLDSEDRIIATTEEPYAEAESFAFLKVVDVNPIGAFLDWGLAKDLFVPFREQKEKMLKGKSYVVFIYIDSSNRIAASSNLDRFADVDTSCFEDNQGVDLLICNQTDIGYKAVVNNSHLGVLYSNEIFQKIEIGDKLKGFIKKIRDDGKIDLCLERPGPAKVNDLSREIFNLLTKEEGFLSVTDKSPPEEIYSLFGVSKKTYKKAIGSLYKKRLINIEKDGIRLSKKPQ